MSASAVHDNTRSRLVSFRFRSKSREAGGGILKTETQPRIKPGCLVHFGRMHPSEARSTSAFYPRIAVGSLEEEEEDDGEPGLGAAPLLGQEEEDAR